MSVKYTSEQIDYESRDKKAFNDLIELAESIKKENDIVNNQFVKQLISLTIIGLATIASFVILYEDPSFELNYSAKALIITLAIIAYLFFVYSFTSYIKRKRRETRAFKEVMSIIHEVLASSEKNQSLLEKA